MRASRPACLCLVAAVILLGVLAAVVVEDVRAEPMPTGPWVDRLEWSEENDPVTGLERLRRGEVDLYMHPLQSTSQGLEALQDLELLTFQGSQMKLALLFNPNEQQPDVPWNPFTDAQIREAMNWLVDRTNIVQAIYGGLATEQVSVFLPGSQDFQQEAQLIRSLEVEYSADFDRATETIASRMAAHNATIGLSGHWEDAEGRVIALQVLGRSEDERTAVGTYVGRQLERAGFRVVVNATSSMEAIPTVYGGDPSVGAWHVYTEGFVDTATVPWDDDALWIFHGCLFEPFCARFGGPATYAPPLDFDGMAGDLANGRYDTASERQSWIRSLLPRTLNETNYRMWLAETRDVFAANARIQSLVTDSHAGPWTHLSLRSAKLLPGQPNVDLDTGIGGTLRVLNFPAFEDAWSPWTEPAWTYDAVQRRAIGDPGMWRNPTSGRWMDVRVQTDVETAGPDGSMAVPKTAIIWNVSRERFVPVEEGTRAVSKVTTHLGNAGRWHTGARIALADALYSFSAAYRLAHGDVWDQGCFWAPIVRAFPVDVVKGIVVDEEKGTIEAYIDSWHVDEREIAARGVMYMWAGDAPVPWEIQEAALQSILDGDTTTHRACAEGTDRAWLDLVRNPDSLAAIDIAFNKIRSENNGQGRIPRGLDPWISLADAQVRYERAQTFREAFGHWYASNGPFVLEVVDAEARTTVMTAFRDGYPYAPDRWDPLVAEIRPDVSFEPFPSSLIGGETVILRFSTGSEGRQADPADTRWFLHRADSNIVPIEGVPIRTGEGVYEVQLLSTQTVGLETGTYDLVVILQGDSGSRVETFTFALQSQTDLLSSRLYTLWERLNGMAEGFQEVEDLVDRTDARLRSLESMAFVVLALTAVAAGTTGISLTLVLRRLRRLLH